MQKPEALYRIRHETRFAYASPVREAFVSCFLQPENSASQHLVDFALTTDPGAQVDSFEDCFGNCGQFFDVPGEHRELRVRARSVVAVHIAPQDAPQWRLTSPSALDGGEAAPIEGPRWEDLEDLGRSQLWSFVNPTDLTRPVPALSAFQRESGLERLAHPLASIRAAAAAIHRSLRLTPGITGVDSPIHEALEARAGVCQDFTHIFLAIVRGWGIPARYASGYVYPYPGEQAQSHAWGECFLPGLGWVGADPANNTVPAGQHIRLATGRDYGDVPPTRGHFLSAGGDEHQLDVAVTIEPLDEDISDAGFRALPSGVAP